MVRSFCTGTGIPSDFGTVWRISGKAAVRYDGDQQKQLLRLEAAAFASVRPYEAFCQQHSAVPAIPSEVSIAWLSLTFR